MVLTGNKIILKPITLEDCEEYVEWRNSSFVSKNFIIQKKYTIEQQTNWINTIVNSKEVEQFIIVDKVSGEKIGSVYLINIELINKKAEFGIFLKSEVFSGKGFGKEATALIIKYGFELLKLNKIYLRVFANNVSAIKLYIKSGFVFEGIAREDVYVNGSYRDMIFMAILKKNYLNVKW